MNDLNLHKKLLKANVTIYVWRTSLSKSNGAPGHASMRMQYPELAAECGQRGLLECGKLVADGMRAARKYDLSAWNYVDPTGQSSNLESQMDPDDAYDGIMGARNRLYLSFWPGGDMPQTYKDDMYYETNSKAHAPLELGSNIISVRDNARLRLEDQEARYERAKERGHVAQMSEIKKVIEELEDSIQEYDQALRLGVYSVKGDNGVENYKVYTPHGNQVPIHQVMAKRSAVQRVVQVEDNEGNRQFVSIAVPTRTGNALMVDDHVTSGFTDRRVFTTGPKTGTRDTYRGQIRNKTYRVVKTWGTKADVDLTLPCLYTDQPEVAPQNTIFGLSLFRMVKWWNAFLDENMEEIDHDRTHQGLDVVEHHSKYNLYSTEHNCAGACVGALKAGGAEAYAPFSGKFGFIATTPNDVEKWVTAVKLRLLFLNAKVKPLCDVIDVYENAARAKGRLGPSGFGTHKQEELMPLRQFKEKTALLGKLRHGHIVNLDTQLSIYHGTGWELDVNFTRKLGCMVAIVTEAHAYFEKYRNNPEEAKRGEGVALLVRQVFDVLTNGKH